MSVPCPATRRYSRPWHLTVSQWETVRARHLRYENEVTGAQEGGQQGDWWVDPVTMLPIRNEHDITINTKLGALTITYTENTSYELTSLTPE